MTLIKVQRIIKRPFAQVIDTSIEQFVVSNVCLLCVWESKDTEPRGFTLMLQWGTLPSETTSGEDWAEEDPAIRYTRPKANLRTIHQGGEKLPVQ